MGTPTTSTETLGNELAQYPELLAELLSVRGIQSRDEAHTFLNPSYDEHCHDPMLLPDMDKAVSRIVEAVRNNERIAIYSDYDCDGIPGGALLHDFFVAASYDNFENYIPHRHEEGYGLNTPALDALAERGANLVITVDSGITDVEQVAHANKLGMDVVVTDHHIPLRQDSGQASDTLPPAVAVVNPKRTDSVYPYDGLCGTGVAFKLACACKAALNAEGLATIPDGKEKWWLDLVGIATIADMVPLIGENRVLTRYGLMVLQKSRRPGIHALCKKMRVDQRTMSEDDVGFMLAPRINAASRMDRPEEAFRLLVTQDEREAGALAEHLNKINDERKGVVAGIVKEIKRRIEALDEIKDIIVMGNPTWRPSLLGLAANSLVEEYNRPVFLWGREGNMLIKGSCRSDGSVNLVEMMTQTDAVLGEFGGHKFAAGFSVVDDKIHSLEEELLAAYKAARNGDEISEEQPADKMLSLDDVSWSTYRQVAMLAPFGDGNPKPVFAFPSVKIARVDHFGKTGAHVKLTFLRSDFSPVEAICFFKTADNFAARLEEGSVVDLTATMEKSHFRRTPELRLRIVDVT